MKGTAAKRRRVLHENTRDLEILVPNIESLTLYLYFDSGSVRRRRQGYRELKFSICRLANALAICGSLKQLSVVLRVYHNSDDKLIKTSTEDERVLDRLLMPFDLLRNLNIADIIIERKSFELHSSKSS